MKVRLNTLPEENGYYKGGSDDVTSEYPEEVSHIESKAGTGSVYLLDHDIVGEICIYVNGKWSGYLSEYQGFHYE